jgi:hypothetical protein
LVPLAQAVKHDPLADHKLNPLLHVEHEVVPDDNVQLTQFDGQAVQF